MTFNKRRL